MKDSRLFPQGIPAVSLGAGTASFRMQAGSFRCRDKSKMHALTEIRETENRWRLEGAGLFCEIAVEKTEDKLVLRFTASPECNRFEISLDAEEDEKIYGCGEQFTHLNLKGQTVPVWVSEHQNAVKIAKKCIREKLFGVNYAHKAKYKDHQTYYASPVFLSSRLYAVLPAATAYGEISFLKDRTVLRFHEIPEKITVLYGDSYASLMKRLAEESPVPPPVPDWTGTGAILAVQGGSAAVREKVAKAKEHGAAVAGVWCQDWSGRLVTSFGSQVFWNWKADETLYEGLPELIEELHGQGIKFLGYINTFLKQDCVLYNEAKEKGYLVMRKEKDGNLSVYHIRSTTFDAAIVDLTNPEAAAWYKDVIKKNMIAYGLDGWMADFGEYLPTDAVIFSGDPARAHNEWPTLWAKTNREALEESGKNSDIFLFNRAAYGTTIPYTGSVWCGDNHVDFSDEYGLPSVIPAMLSMACCGTGVTHSDIGGYTTIMHMKRSPELLIRWAELNVFTPVFRCHEGNRPGSNAQFSDDSVIDAFSALSRLFALLKPYRDHVLRLYYTEGMPCNRPLFFHSDEPWCYTCQDAFLFGEDVLVSPVLRPDVQKKEIRLPEGEWERFFTGDVYTKGGVYTVDTPLGVPVAFYRRNSGFAGFFRSIPLNF